MAINERIKQYNGPVSSLELYVMRTNSHLSNEVICGGLMHGKWKCVL